MTYVTVSRYDDDDAVIFAAAAAYTGVMIAWGCAVWGTGYYYRPSCGYGGYYPFITHDIQHMDITPGKTPGP